jgi:hypothetical protein
MKKYSGIFVGFDTAKKKHAVAIAEGGCSGEIRYLGEIDSSPATVEKVLGKLAAPHAKRFEHAAQQIVFQDAINAVEDAATRLHELDQQLLAIVPTWSMMPVVAAYQAMRGVSFVVAVTFAAEVGDVRRFDNPRQFLAFLGLVPGERSTGETIYRGGPPWPAIGGPGAYSSRVRGLTATRHASARLCASDLRSCRKPCAPSPGRRSSVSAPAIAGSSPPARSHPWSSPRSRAKWPLSFWAIGCQVEPLA